MVSKSLEIKDLSTGIEINDQISSNEKNIERDVLADEDLDNNEDPASHMNEDDAKVEQTKPRDRPIIEIDSVNKRVERTDGKYICNLCDHQFTTQSNL